MLLLIEDYERRHFPIDSPDPIDFLLNVMQWRGLSRKDLEPHIGSRARVAELLNRVRARWQPGRSTRRSRRYCGGYSSNTGSSSPPQHQPAREP